jgi:hypothetical protein
MKKSSSPVTPDGTLDGIFRILLKKRYINYVVTLTVAIDKP